MYASIAVLSLLFAQEAKPTPTDATGYGMPDPNEFFPLPATHPGLGGFLLSGGFTLGQTAGLWQSAGWKFCDGSTCDVSIGRWDRLFGISSCTPIYQTETYRSSLVGGTGGGMLHEWYLGYGVSALLDHAGLSIPCHAAIAWYPTEGIRLAVGYDVLRACWDCDWSMLF